MSNKCETSRHIEMPLHCLNAKHVKCEACDRCYSCHQKQMPVTRLTGVDHAS